MSHPQQSLPYEADYTGHREAARRRDATRQWLREREASVKERHRPETTKPKLGDESVH